MENLHFLCSNKLSCSVRNFLPPPKVLPGNNQPPVENNGWYEDTYLVGIHSARYEDSMAYILIISHEFRKYFLIDSSNCQLPSVEYVKSIDPIDKYLFKE